MNGKARAPRPAAKPRKEYYDVVNMPPPWRRSLTESGMRRRTTTFDIVIVALFFVALFTLAGLFVASIVAS